jgi:hypothetical protein
VQQMQGYDDWNQANYRKYKFAVQGRYMDWVANGHKTQVEHNFVRFLYWGSKLVQKADKM